MSGPFAATNPARECYHTRLPLRSVTGLSVGSRLPSPLTPILESSVRGLQCLRWVRRGGRARHEGSTPRRGKTGTHAPIPVARNRTGEGLAG